MTLFEKNDFKSLKEGIALLEGLGEYKDAPERAVLDLRYFRDMTQQKTGEALGLSQVKVSRMEKKALQKLRALLI